MSDLVRRLVFDISPAWLWGLGFVWLCFAAFDGLWLVRPSVPPPLAILLAASSLCGLVWVKTPIWSLLPVSRAVRARAQWRLLIGGPLLAFATALTAVCIVMAPLGLDHRTLADVVAVLGGQVATYMTVCSAILIAARARLSRIVWVIGLLTLPPLVLMPTLWLWFTMTDVVRAQMELAGAAGLVAAAAWYALGPRAPLIGMKSGLAPSMRAPRGRRTVHRAAPPGPRGWLAFNPVSIATLIGLVVTGVVGARLVVAFDAALSPVLPVLFSIMGLVCGMVYFGSLPMRLLRGLPIGGGRLTLILFAIGIGLQQLVVMALLALCALCLPVTLISSDLAWIVAVSTSLCALTLPLRLRVGPVRAIMIIGAPLICFSGPLAVALISRAPRHSTTPFAPAVVVGAVVIVAVVWAWWEISRDRPAYRTPPALPSS